MLRLPISLKKMTYDAATGMVIYRSKMRPGLKRKFQVTPGAEWLALLCKHIPDRYQHWMRYVAWYSNRTRAERANKAVLLAGITLPSPAFRCALCGYSPRPKPRSDSGEPGPTDLVLLSFPRHDTMASCLRLSVRNCQAGPGSSHYSP